MGKSHALAHKKENTRAAALKDKHLNEDSHQNLYS